MEGEGKTGGCPRGRESMRKDPDWSAGFHIGSMQEKK